MSPTILLIWVATIAISLWRLFALLPVHMLGLCSCWRAEGGHCRMIWSGVGPGGILPFSILSSLVGVLLVAVPRCIISRVRTIAPKQDF